MTKGKERKMKSYLGIIRRTAVQSITFMWLAASACLVFTYMGYKFFPDQFMAVIIVLLLVLTVASGFMIKRIETLIKSMWDRI